MTPEQIELVKDSWKKVEPISDTAANLFYSRLFEEDPSLKALFKGDIKEQGQKLMKMITVAVNGLDKLDTIVPAVQSLGKRHTGYGVKEQHYDTVGSSLIWTPEQGLGDAFDDATRGA